MDSPFFCSQGINEGVAAYEPAANEALMGLATGDLVYYGKYFEMNKMLRQLTSERETRVRFVSQTFLRQQSGADEDDDL